MKNELEKIAYVYGDVCLRKQRRKRQKLLIIELLLDYAKNSTLHGLRYIAQQGLSTIEKLFWIATFVVSISFCSLLIKNVYLKWKYSPVIVTVSERFVSAGEVPFPSVTICPQIKSKATVFNISSFKESGNATEEDKAKFADVSMLCLFDEGLAVTDRNFTDATIVKHIEEVSPSVDDVFAYCDWHSVNIDCSEMFKKVYTSEGLCFNMNGLAVDEMLRGNVQKDYNYSERNQSMSGWSVDDSGRWYAEISNGHFPKLGSENGASPNLEVLLQSKDEDVDGVCNGVNSGYRIYIHHPADFPQSSLYYYAAVNTQVSSLAVSFNLLGTSDALKPYSSEERQCYFPNDRTLKYFKIYTMKNCRAECLSNYTLARCGCVGYYMLHDNSSQTCAENKLSCMQEAHDEMANQELQLELTKREGGCRCLPSCNTIEYEAEVLKTEFHIKRYLKKVYGDGFYQLLFKNTSFSKVEMYFKKPRFVSMRRSELFGLTDFLANIGGLLGVFLGFSFLSLVEILYFMTLRVGFSLKRDLKEEKRNRENSIRTLAKNN